MSELLREQYFASDMPDGYFDLLPQQAVRCVPFPAATKHNAVWDFLLEEDGTAYVPLCGELSQPLSVQLYRFDTNSGNFHFCFDASKEFFVGNREIPPSKIHTSLSKLNDGRLLMTTHTTARSPRHPYWLFDSYFEHIHEGYPGSHMLIYDPENGTVKNLGIPVKRDSIYGGCYDPAHNAFFFTTFLKGKLFRFDLDKFELRDLGQITEGGSYCVFPDGRGGIFYIEPDRAYFPDRRFDAGNQRPRRRRRGRGGTLPLELSPGAGALDAGTGREDLFYDAFQQ